MSQYPAITLKPAREKSVKRRHPWIFSGAIQHVQGEPQAGETVAVYSADKVLLGVGAYSPLSQIRVRLWSFEAQDVDQAFLTSRIARAYEKRVALGIVDQTNAYRVIAAESDGLPGLIVDRYDGWLVCQFVSVGAERVKAEIIEGLRNLPDVKGIYDRSDVEVRKKEGLEQTTGVLWGAAPPQHIRVHENGVKFLVDVISGHKTGFYLDQRDNRLAVSQYAEKAEVLNCFAYTGGFGLAALHGGATHVTNLEDVGAMLEMVNENVAFNAFDPARCSNEKANVFKRLREYVETGKQFDLIVLDPPKFAESQSRLKGACRGYKDINRLAFLCLKPGGMLFTFSCSGLMKLDLFQKVVADAAIDAQCDVQLLRWLGQSSDHPVDMSIPETQYLKGLILRKNPA